MACGQETCRTGWFWWLNGFGGIMKRENRVQVTPGVPQWWKSEGRAPWGGDGDHDCDDNGLEAL